MAQQPKSESVQLGACPVLRRVAGGHVDVDAVGIVMTDRLREALEWWKNLTQVWPPEENGNLETIVAAARRFLALTETGRRLVDAVNAMYDDSVDELFTAEEEEWDELLDAALELRAALADDLTEEE